RFVPYLCVNARSARKSRSALQNSAAFLKALRYGPTVIRPILLRPDSVNQSPLSGPAVIPSGPLPGVGIGNSLKLPEVVIRPILLPKNSVNQSAPSGPGVIRKGPLPGAGIGNSRKLP